MCGRRIFVSVLIGLLLCLTFMGGISRYMVPAAHGDVNPVYQSSETSWPGTFPANGIITYSGDTASILPTATQINDTSLRLQFAESLESATNDRSRGEGVLGFTYLNFSINGNTVGGMNVDLSRYNLDSTSRRVFDVVEITTQTPIQPGDQISYAFSGKPDALAVPNRTQLLAPFTVPIGAAPTLTSVTVNGSPVTPSGTRYTATVDATITSATVALAASDGSISCKGPSDLTYVPYVSPFSVNLTQGSNLVSIKVSNGGLTTDYTLAILRGDEAFLTDLKVYYRDWDGVSSETTTTPPFNPAMRGRTVLETPPFDAITGTYARTFYVVPTANDGTEIRVNDSPCASGQPSAAYSFPPTGDLSIPVTLTGAMTGESSTSYTVVIKRKASPPMLKSLVVSPAIRYRQYPDVAPTLLKLAAADLTNGSSFDIDNCAGNAWTAYIYGDLLDTGLLTSQYKTVQIDGQTVSLDSRASFSSQGFEVRVKQEKDVEVKVSDALSGRVDIVRLRLRNSFAPVERVYLGVPPEILAEAENPLDIRVDVNGFYMITSKSGSTLIGPGLSALAATTQPHQTEFEIPWSVWPPNAMDRNDVKIFTNMQGMGLSVTHNQERNGGVVKVTRYGDAGFYTEEALEKMGYVERIDGSVFMARMSSGVDLGDATENREINSHRNPDYKVNLSFATVDTPTFYSYKIKPIELWPGNTLPIINPVFGAFNFVVQFGQSYVVPLSSVVSNWGAYMKLPREMREKYPRVYTWYRADELAVPLDVLYHNLYSKYNGEIPARELNAFNAALINYSLSDDGFSFTMEWDIGSGQVEILKQAGIDINQLGKPSDYLTAVWEDGDAWFGTAGVRVTCVDAPPEPVRPLFSAMPISIAMLPVRLTARTNILKEVTSTTIYLPCESLSQAADVPGEASALILNPRTYGFWQNEDVNRMVGNNSFMMVPLFPVGAANTPLMTPIGAATTFAVFALLDMIQDIVEDLIVAKGDIRIVWRNLEVNQSIQYKGDSVNWALRFYNNNTRTAEVPDGVMWNVYASGLLNNGRWNQVFTPYGDLDKPSGSTYPGVFGKLNVLADNEAARRFFESRPWLLPLVGGNVNNAKGRYGPYELKVSGETKHASVSDGGPLIPATLTNSVLFFNLDPIDPEQENSRTGSGLSASGGVSRKSLPIAPGRMSTRAAESDGQSRQWLYASPVVVNEGGDFTAFHDDTASVKVLVSLSGNPSANVMKAGADSTGSGMIESVVPMISFADNIVVRDVNGNLVNSGFELLESNAPLPESAKNSTAYKIRKAAAAGSSGSESFIVEFEVPSRYLEQAEITEIYFRREDSLGFEVAKMTGDGVNGGFTLSEHNRREAPPQESEESDNGGGCSAAGLGLVALVPGVALLKRR